jgi:hypothetical protein
MNCQRCNGRMFLDRVFSDNKNFEVYCILCGDRKFVSKGTEFGTWLSQVETDFRKEKSLVN